MLHATQSTASDGTGATIISKSQLDQIAKKLMSSTMSKDDEKDLEEEFDADSDAMEQEATERQKAEEEQMVKSLPSDPSASAADDEKEQNEEEEDEEEESVGSSLSIDSLDEEAVISSRSFAKEFESAIDHISEIAKSHRAEMIESVKERIEAETGQFVSDEMVSSAMKPFAVQQIESMDLGATTDEESAVSAEDADSVDVDDESDVDDADFEEPTAAESLQILRCSSVWAEALESVRSLGRGDQEELVNSLCSIHLELNDEEPTLEELHSMFSGIRARFHEEAMELSESEDESVEEVDAESFAEEMELALAAVRKQAQQDQEGLVSFIADSFLSVNGREPTVEELSGVLGRIQLQFHEECRSLFLEQNEDDDADSDSDYELEGDQEAEQYAEDEAEDIYIDGEHEAATFSEFSSSEQIDNIEYDPMDDDAQSLYSRDELDDEELSAFASAEELASSEFEEETESEDDIVNSAQFAVEWQEALQSVHDLAKSDQQRLLQSVDEQATDSMVEAAMESLKEAVIDYDSGDDLEEEEALDLEMQSALQSVRDLGAADGQALALRVSELYREEIGQEISVQELAAIFSEVQDCFAEEALSSDDGEGEVEGEEFADLYSEAMDHVVEIAKCHREEVVAKFAQIYDEENCNPPTKGAIAEMMQSVVESFADEAMDELLDDDLPTDSEDDDSSYSPESDIADHSDYQFDALDLALYLHSSSDHESDVDFDADLEAEDLKDLYLEDADLDLADSESSENEEAELKQSEVESDEESEYSPDRDDARYFSDYQAEYASTSSSAADTDQSDSASLRSGAESEDADYNPDYDLFDYSLDSQSQSELQSESDQGSEQSLLSEAEPESDRADGSQSEQESDDDDDDDDEDYDEEEEADSADYGQDEFEEYSGDEAEEDQDAV